MKKALFLCICIAALSGCSKNTPKPTWCDQPYSSAQITIKDTIVIHAQDTGRFYHFAIDPPSFTTSKGSYIAFFSANTETDIDLGENATSELISYYNVNYNHPADHAYVHLNYTHNTACDDTVRSGSDLVLVTITH